MESKEASNTGRRALLMCRHVCQKPTWHVFFRDDVARHSDGTPIQTNHIYTCTVCGHDRRWGAEGTQHGTPEARQ